MAGPDVDRLQPERVLQGPVHLAEPDPSWPRDFDEVAGRIRRALGAKAVDVVHVGSTSVPGLAAKPVIDMVLLVADPADEPAYVPALDDAGFTLHLREPGWHQHRLLKSTRPQVNVHVFAPGAVEVRRMVAFRDRLRASAEDRLRYERAKRELAARTWRTVQDYADAKTGVVEQILARAGSGPP
jgi:GrpB-like predicted nucleotidyltransferase (UPF0157 family)